MENTQKNDKIQKSQNFSVFSDKNTNYHIFIHSKKNDEINFIAIEILTQIKYSCAYPLNKLKNNKYLSSLYTIDEIFDDKIEKKLPKLIEEENLLKLVIETGHTKFKEINIYFIKKEKSFLEKYNELYLIINEFKEKEKKQDEKIKLLEEEIQELKNNNYELYEKNQILEDNIETLKQILNINDYNYYINEEQVNNNETQMGKNLNLNNSSPYIPKSMRVNKNNNNELNYNINLNEKPYIPKNIKQNEKKENKK